MDMVDDLNDAMEEGSNATGIREDSDNEEREEGECTRVVVPSTDMQARTYTTKEEFEADIKKYTTGTRRDVKCVTVVIARYAEWLLDNEGSDEDRRAFDELMNDHECIRKVKESRGDLCKGHRVVGDVELWLCKTKQHITPMIWHALFVVQNWVEKDKVPKEFTRRQACVLMALLFGVFVNAHKSKTGTTASFVENFHLGKEKNPSSRVTLSTISDGASFTAFADFVDLGAFGVWFPIVEIICTYVWTWYACQKKGANGTKDFEEALNRHFHRKDVRLDFESFIRKANKNGDEICKMAKEMKLLRPKENSTKSRARTTTRVVTNKRSRSVSPSPEPPKPVPEVPQKATLDDNNNAQEDDDDADFVDINVMKFDLEKNQSSMDMLVASLMPLDSFRGAVVNLMTVLDIARTMAGGIRGAGLSSSPSSSHGDITANTNKLFIEA